MARLLRVLAALAVWWAAGGVQAGDFRASFVRDEAGATWLEVQGTPGALHVLEASETLEARSFTEVAGGALYGQAGPMRWFVAPAPEVVTASGGPSRPARTFHVNLRIPADGTEVIGIERIGDESWTAVMPGSLPRRSWFSFMEHEDAISRWFLSVGVRVASEAITGPARSALTAEAAREYDAVQAALPRLLASMTRPLEPVATAPEISRPPGGQGQMVSGPTRRFFRVVRRALDSNGNGLTDDMEIALGFRPFGRAGEPGTWDPLADADGNGVADGIDWWGDGHDTDGDLSPDFEEAAAGTSPLLRESAIYTLGSHRSTRTSYFSRDPNDPAVINGWWEFELGATGRDWQWNGASILTGTPHATNGSERGWSLLNGDGSVRLDALGPPDPERGLPPLSVMGSSGDRLGATAFLQCDGDLMAQSDATRVWWRGPARPVPVSRTFLKVTDGRRWDATTTPSGTEEVETSTGLAFEPVTFTIPAGENLSAHHDLLPELQNAAPVPFHRQRVDVRINEAPIVSRDRFVAGGLPPGLLPDMEVEFIGPGGRSLGRYGDLDGTGSTRIHDEVTDIMATDADGQLLHPDQRLQRVWFVRQAPHAGSIGQAGVSWYMLADSLGLVTLKFYRGDELIPVGMLHVMLTADPEFAGLIAKVDTWVRGTPWNGAAAGGNPPGGVFVGNHDPLREELLAYLSAACLIPCFNIIANVEGLVTVVHGLLDGVWAGLKDDLGMLADIARFAVFQATWQAEMARDFVALMSGNDTARTAELKRMLDQLCTEIVFPAISAMAISGDRLLEDLKTWEGWRRRAWDSAQMVWGGVKGYYEFMWNLPSNAKLIALDALCFVGMELQKWADAFCARTLDESQKTAFNSLPWPMGGVLNDARDTSRHMAYVFGYTFGYLVEQVVAGGVVVKTGKFAFVMAKQGISFVGTLARRTVSAIVLQAQAIKHTFKEGAQITAEQYLRLQSQMASAGRTPPWGLAEEGATLASPAPPHLRVTAEQLGDGEGFDFLRYLQTILDSPGSRTRDFLMQGDLVAQAATKQMLLDRMAQLKHILGNEYTEALGRNFMKAIEDFILVRRPDGTVDECFEGFFKATEGNPSLMKHADDAYVATGGPADPLSEGAKSRLKQLLRDPIPGEPHPEIGNPWRLDVVEDWSVYKPIPRNYFARGILIEIRTYKKTYKPAGFKHHPSEEGFDCSSAADDVFVQVKAYSNPDGATAAAKEAIDSLLRTAPAHARLQLHIVHPQKTATNPAVTSANLKAALDAYLNSGGVTQQQRARFLPTIFEEFVYP